MTRHCLLQPENFELSRFQIRAPEKDKQAFNTFTVSTKIGRWGIYLSRIWIRTRKSWVQTRKLRRITLVSSRIIPASSFLGFLLCLFCLVDEEEQKIFSFVNLIILLHGQLPQRSDYNILRSENCWMKCKVILITVSTMIFYFLVFISSSRRMSCNILFFSNMIKNVF